MSNTRKKDNFIDVVQIIQAPKPATPKVGTQVTTSNGTVVTLGVNTKTHK